MFQKTTDAKTTDGIEEIKTEENDAKPDEIIVANQIDVEEVRLITTPVSLCFRREMIRHRHVLGHCIFDRKTRKTLESYCSQPLHLFLPFSLSFLPLISIFLFTGQRNSNNFNR